MMSCKSLEALLLLFVMAPASSCVPTDLLPIGSGAKAFQTEDDEKTLWQISEQIQQRLEKSGLLYEDADFDSYLNGLATRLLDGQLERANVAPRIRVIKDPFFSAFTLPNGAIYFHTGLLAHIENEAQLATVLGHELTHFLRRHALKDMRHARNRATAGSVLQVILAASTFGVLTELPAAWTGASISGYSRELEIEADEGGLRAIVNAGYDPKESVKALELLKQDWEERIKGPFFSGIDPRIQERIDNNLRLLNGEYRRAANEAGRQRNTENFLARINRLLLDNAMLDLDRGRYPSAQTVIEIHLARQPDSPRGHFLLAEFYRRSGRSGDAVSAYLRAATLDPAYAEPHRELGLLYRALSRSEDARGEFEKYLALKPEAVDAPIIAGYIGEARLP